MIKIIRLALVGVVSAGAAVAGAVAYVAPAAPVMIEEPTGSMGGSGMWLIPLIAIALIAVAIGAKDDSSGYNN